MTVHDWAEIPNGFVVRPVMARVRLMTAIAFVIVAAFFALAFFTSGPGALVLVVAVLVPWIPLTYVRHRFRRARITLENDSVKVESSTWAGAGRWVTRAECDLNDVVEVGYCQHGARSTRILLTMEAPPAIVATDIELSDEDAESLAEAIASRLSVPVKEYSKRDLLAAT